MNDFNALFDDADLTVIALPRVAAQLGYNLAFDGHLYTATNSDGGVIGQFNAEHEAVTTVMDYATSEANAIDNASPMTEEEIASLMLLVQS